MGEGLQLESGGPFKTQFEPWPFKSVSVSPDVRGRAGSLAVYRPAASLTPRSSERRSRRVCPPLKGPAPERTGGAARRRIATSYHAPRPQTLRPFAAGLAAGFPSLPRSPFSPSASPGSQQPAASRLSHPQRVPTESPGRVRPLASWGHFLRPVTLPPALPPPAAPSPPWSLRARLRLQGGDAS